MADAFKFDISTVATQFTMTETTFSGGITPFLKLPVTVNNPRRYALIFSQLNGTPLQLSTLPDTPGLIDGGLVLTSGANLVLTIKDHATLPFQTWLASGGGAAALLTVIEVLQNP